jgi:hypothetical protein
VNASEAVSVGGLFVINTGDAIARNTPSVGATLEAPQDDFQPIFQNLDNCPQTCCWGKSESPALIQIENPQHWMHLTKMRIEVAHSRRLRFNAVGSGDQ